MVSFWTDQQLFGENLWHFRKVLENPGFYALLAKENWSKPKFCGAKQNSTVTKLFSVDFAHLVLFSSTNCGFKKKTQIKPDADAVLSPCEQGFLTTLEMWCLGFNVEDRRNKLFPSKNATIDKIAFVDTVEPPWARFLRYMIGDSRLLAHCQWPGQWTIFDEKFIFKKTWKFSFCLQYFWWREKMVIFYYLIN